MKLATAILAVLLGNVASFPQNQAGGYDMSDPYRHESPQTTHTNVRCNPGESYHFWCDDKVRKHRYPRTCIGGNKFDEGDRTPCQQADLKPDGGPPSLPQEYTILQPNSPPNHPPQQPSYNPPQQSPYYPPQQLPHYPPQHQPQQPPHYPPQQPPHYPPHQGPHHPTQQYHKKPEYAPPGDAPPQEHPEYPPHQSHQQQHNNYGYYHPQGRKTSNLLTIPSLFLIQKLMNKDGADNLKFEDLVKYYLMFQRPGVQGGNNHQLLALMYGLPGLEKSSSLDMSDILKYLIGNSGGMGGMGPLAGMGALGGMGGLLGMGALGDMDGLGDMAGLLTNPMLAGMLGNGDGDNPFSSMLGLGGDDSMSLGSLISLMGNSGLGGNMPPMGFPPLGGSGPPGLYSGSSPILSALLSSMNSGS